LNKSFLPELKVNPKHDFELQGLAEEQAQLLSDAEKILQRARDSWASSADVKLDTNTSTNAKSTMQHFLLRTIRADERQLKASNSSVEIVSILKTGVYFTVPALRTISDRYATIQDDYREQQQELVVKALETAATYTPLLECVAHLIAELDVLVSFSSSAALSPGVYVRPTLLQKGGGVLQLEQARHPCVELMDGVNFIPNNYDLVRGTSGFQIVTGPNMGGKSTYIRAVGTIAVMAQVGMFVPCKKATVSIVDCILARVGAGDAVQKG
jgi:DNA mismatch repair protein MSH2